jgi:glycosyltransferase involved in cell wall biosynthesis
MKIARIISAYAPYTFGGADIYAQKISESVAKKGNPTVVITISPERGYEKEQDAKNNTVIYRFHPFNISTVHRIGRKPLFHQGLWSLFDVYSPYSFHMIRSILKREKPDLVHIHTPIDVTLAAVDAAKSLHLPIVYTLHDYFLLCRRVVLLHGSGAICTRENVNPLCKAYRSFCRFVVNAKIDQVIAPSEFVLNKHKEEGFFASNKCAVLPHGIDLEKQPMQKRAWDKGRALSIIYSGGLTRHKGVHVLIDAVQGLPQASFKLHLVGSGVFETELRNHAAGNPSIIFHGRCDNSRITYFYRDADVAVVPSIWYDVRPNVIPEAFRSGVPVIGSAIGGIPELIRHGVTGYLVKPGDVDELRELLAALIRDPGRLVPLSENVLKFVQQFEMNAYIDRLIRVYEKTVKEYSG